MPPGPSGVPNSTTQLHLIFLSAHCYGRLSGSIGLHGRNHIEWSGNTALIKHAPSSHMEMAINRTYLQDQTPQTSQYDTVINVEGESCEKPTRESRFDEDTENGAGSPTQLP